MSSKQITALLIILLYMALTIVIGLVVSKRKAKKKAEQSNEDFLMAGKSLGPLALAGTLFAANTGGASTTGIATNVFQYGLSASWYVIAGGIGFILVSFIAPYFRRAAASTVPQIIGARYGKPSHIITAFTSITALFMATGAQIIATASISDHWAEFPNSSDCDDGGGYRLYHDWRVCFCGGCQHDACFIHYNRDGHCHVRHGRKSRSGWFQRFVCQGICHAWGQWAISGFAEYDKNRLADDFWICSHVLYDISYRSGNRADVLLCERWENGQGRVCDYRDFIGSLCHCSGNHWIDGLHLY